MIEIDDVSVPGEERYKLLIDGQPKALLQKKGGLVQLNWQVYGPQYWPQAKELMQGLLDLSVLADKLSGEQEWER